MQCDYFDAGRCRSCALMGVPYAVQLAEKLERCQRALAPVAPHVTWLEPFASRESAFRNKAKLVVGGRTGAVTVGILDPESNGVDLRACGLHEEPLQRLIPRLADAVDAIGLEPYDVKARRGELKHLILTLSPAGDVMLRFVLRSKRHLALLESRLPRLLEHLSEVRVVSVNLQPEHKAVLEGDTEIVLTEQGLLEMPVNDVTLNLRPNSFFQTNTAVAAGLYRQARDWAHEVRPDAVLDLYCGVGGFALHLADGVGSAPDRVLGIEVSAEAVRSAELSAERLRAASPTAGDVRFRVGDATDVSALDPAALGGAGWMVVVNPPRRGIGPELAAWIERSGADHVVYSSCNVDSLARDLVGLPSYAARRARLFDMFPQASHHEVMVLLERQRGTTTTASADGGLHR
ncbi:MAG: methyltransferase domain-containing protein [Dermatophilaceae bacterium]|nr:methyltransferase domain-containing protein [Dermatophilaceae bacterium]